MEIEVEIDFNGIKLNVVGDFTPEEPMVMYYPDGSGHPGSSEELEIHHIYWNSVDIYDIYNSLDEIWDIEQEALKKYDYAY